jgi:hypothetical protein
MRSGLGFAALAVGLVVSSVPALATDNCLVAVNEVGRWKSSERAAMGSAIGAWERKVSHKISRRYADYWYSGERVFNCTWKADGSAYKCAVSARPCARVR